MNIYIYMYIYHIIYKNVYIYICKCLNVNVARLNTTNGYGQDEFEDEAESPTKPSHLSEGYTQECRART